MQILSLGSGPCFGGDSSWALVVSVDADVLTQVVGSCKVFTAFLVRTGIGYRFEDEYVALDNSQFGQLTFFLGVD